MTKNNTTTSRKKRERRHQQQQQQQMVVCVRACVTGRKKGNCMVDRDRESTTNEYNFQQKEKQILKKKNFFKKNPIQFVYVVRVSR